MEDLYDEDFEDLVSDMPEREREGIVGLRSEISDAQDSNKYDDDFYSAAPSSAIEPLGPEATVESDPYDDDFYSANPSAVLDQRSTLTAEEPATPILMVQRLSNSYPADVINSAIDASAKGLSDLLEGAVLVASSVVENNADSWDEAEAAADIQAPLLEPFHEASLIEVNNTEESVYYEDDFAASVDEIAPPHTLANPHALEVPVDHDDPTVGDCLSVEKEATPMTWRREEFSHILPSTHSVQTPHETVAVRDSAQEDSLALLPAVDGTENAAAAVVHHFPLLEEAELSVVRENLALTQDSEQRLVPELAPGPDQEEAVADPPHATSPGAPHSALMDSTDNIELYNEDFDVSISEKAAFSQREIDALEMEMKISVPAETSTVQLAGPTPEATYFAAPEIIIEGTIIPVADDLASRIYTPPVGKIDDRDEKESIVHTNTASTIDDLVLTETNESAASILSADYVGDIVSTASQKALTVLSPAKKSVPRVEPTSEVADNDGFEQEYDDFEAFEDSPVLTSKTPSHPLLMQTPEPEQGLAASQEPLAPVSPFSPVENFIAATFLQAQANLSRPQSAVSRDPALTSATLSEKMPVSAKLAESFVERSVSQARVNVVMGSPTRSPAQGGPIFEEPMSAAETENTISKASENVSQVVEVPADVQSPTSDQALDLEQPAFEPPATEEAESATTANLNDTQPPVMGIGEAAMNDHLGSSSLVLEDAHNKSTKSVAYDDFLGTLGLATPSADSKKAAQLRAMVSETRTEGEEAAVEVPKKKLTKREQQEADRTFLTSLQYHPPVQQTRKIVNSSSGPNLRPSSSKPAVPRGPVTKRDLLRARSAGPNRPAVQEPQAPPPKAAVPKRKSLSPNRYKPPSDHRTKFVAAPLCLPSQMLPKDLLNYLFASNQESELHIARFCQHGRHFDTCKVELCMDAYEKYRWLNLTHQKAKDACELVSDADHMWREKLERALEKEIEEKKTTMEEELSALSAKLIKQHNASVKLLKQGVRYYESILPALHQGKVSPQELHKATGWTEEHYENFKRRLQLEEDQAHFKRKMKLDQQAHKNLEVIEQLKASLISPMMYLDGMLKQRLEKIHSAVKRIDLCFQYSIKLAIGNGKGKSEEEIKAEKEARSPMRNAIVAERMQRNTKHGFEILKASLASIADVCSEVRVMYQGIKRDHDPKLDKRAQEAATPTGVPRSRSASPERRSPSPNARTKRNKRPKSAPTSDSPARRASSRPKSRGRSATTHTTHSAAAARSKPAHQEPSLERASKMSYGEDFESASALDEHNDIAEESIEIKEDTYDEQISDMMRDMMGSVVEEDDSSRSRRPSKASRASRDRARSDSGSIAEESMHESGSAQRPHSNNGNGVSGSKKNGGVRAFPSLTMSVGSGIEEFDTDLIPGLAVSEKGAVMARAKALALSRSPGGRNYAPDEEDEDEIASEVDDDVGFSRDNNDNHHKVSNMYDDDFEGGGSELLKGAFSSSKKNSSTKRGTSRKKKKSTSQKVAHLINADPLVKPLANMKHSQMNDQSILHGILLSHNIPIHYTDEPEVTAVQKLKPLIITNNLNQPVVLSLTSPSKQFTSIASASASRPKSAEPLRTSPLLNPRASVIVASLRLPEKLVRGQIRCYHCGELFAASKAKHIPTTAVSSDTTVFERAKVRQKETGKLFPTYDKLRVTSDSEAQKQWILEQQERQQTLVATPKAGDHKRASSTLQRFEHPFCSWECVKAWIYANYPPHQRYQYDILIDATAGFTVQAKVC